MTERSQTPLAFLRSDWFFAAALLAIVMAAYYPAWNGPAVFDDNTHITAPELRTLGGLWRIWTEPGIVPQYYPIFHSMFWLQQKLWGDSMLGYHLLNLVLHAAVAFLAMVFLRRLEVPGARLAALIFALHPVHVESVAYISEMKNTLSGAFCLGAAIAYLRFDAVFARRECDPEFVPHPSDWVPHPSDWVPHPSDVVYRLGVPTPIDANTPKQTTLGGGTPNERPAAQQVDSPVGQDRTGPAAQNVWTAYALSLVLFILGLLSKGVIATMPAALLVIFWWKRGRLSWRTDVLPLVPFFILGLAGGLMTAHVEVAFVGARGADYDLTIAQRCLVAGRAVWFYLGKLFFPAELVLIYPRWNVDQGAWWQYLFPLGFLGLLGVLWELRRWNRGPLAAMLVFAGTLLPVLGFLNVYPFIYSFVADHYQYLASLCPIALFSAIVTTMAERRFVPHPGDFVPHPNDLVPHPSDWVPHPSDVVYRLGVPTQIDANTPKQTTLGCGTPNERPAAQNTGETPVLHMAKMAMLQEAMLQNSMPQKSMLQNSIAPALAAVLLATLGAMTWRHSGAFADPERLYGETLQANPKCWMAWNNLGTYMVLADRAEEALPHIHKALDLKGDYSDAHLAMGNALVRLNRIDEAITQFEEAVRCKPGSEKAHANLGVALSLAGRSDEAIEHYKQAMVAHAESPELNSNMGIALTAAGRPAEAIKYCRRALRSMPDNAIAHYNLANALVLTGQLDEGIAEYRQALRLRGDYIDAHRNLGVILAKQGRFAEAIEHYRKVLSLQPADRQVQGYLQSALRAAGQTQ